MTNTGIVYAFADGPARAAGNAVRSVSAVAGRAVGPAGRPAADTCTQAGTMHPALRIPGPPRGLLLA